MHLPWPLRMLLILWPFILLISFYLIRRVHNSLSLLRSAPLPGLKKILHILWLWVNAYPVVVFVLFLTGKYTPDYLVEGKFAWVDWLFTYPFVLAFLISVTAFPYLLLVQGIGRLGRKRFSAAQHRLLAWVQLGIVGLLIVWVPWKSYQDTQTVRLRTHTIQLGGKSSVFQDFSILLTADIQADRYTGSRELRHLATIADTTDYQLALFAGDLITYSPAHLPLAVPAMCRFPQKAPSVACMGDHDYWFAPKAVPEKLRHCGWTFLENRHKLVRWKDKLILVTGITNIYSKPISREYLERLLDMAPPAQLKILLVHQPKQWIADLAEKYEYHLMVGGHTHGGQVAIPLFGWQFTPTMLENGYYSGLYRHGKLHVVVTNGIGLTFIPLRFGAPAEVTRIVINPRNKPVL